MIENPDNSHLCTGLPCPICHGDYMRISHTRTRSVPRRAVYEVVSVADTTITIRDLNGPLSVTNDADNVVKEVLEWKRQNYKANDHFKILYYDSDGNLDELCHDGEKFTGFAPGPGRKQT